MSSFNNPLLERFLQNQDNKRAQANFETEQQRLRDISEQTFKSNEADAKFQFNKEMARQAEKTASVKRQEAERQHTIDVAKQVFLQQIQNTPGVHSGADTAVDRYNDLPVWAKGDAANVTIPVDFGSTQTELNLGDLSRSRQGAQEEAQRIQDFASQGAFDKESAKAQAQDPFKREKAEATSNLRLGEIIARGDQARQTMREKLALQGKEKVLASELGEGEKTLYGSFRTGDAEPSRGKQGIIERDRFSTLFPGQVPMPKLVKKQLIEIDKQIFPLEQMEQIMSRYPDIFSESQRLATVRGGAQRLLDLIGFSEFQKELKSLFAISPQVAKGLGEDRLTELDIQRTIGAMIDGGITKKQALENIVRFKQRAINATKASRGAVPEFQVYEQYPNIAAVAKSLRSATEKQKPKEKGALTFSPEVEASLAAAAEEAGLDARGAAALRRRYATIQGQQ